MEKVNNKILKKLCDVEGAGAVHIASWASSDTITHDVMSRVVKLLAEREVGDVV